MRFYGELFGWQFADSEEHGYAMGRLRGRNVAGIGNARGGASPAPAWNTYLRVDSADEAASRAGDEGGSVLMAPLDVAPAGRLAVLADPSGAAFCVWEPSDHQGAQLVNEPGAWSMSMLSSTDPDSAESFYGALFGWTTETFELGGGEITMWRLPGYVGGEPEQPVSREVVATMMPAMEGEPSRWSVDFWVADIDAAAATAESNGGSVVQPPYDIPGPAMRQAVLADPAGATFTATQLVLPADA
jgi:uncharacterized protein